jgi:hypothetical protein
MDLDGFLLGWPVGSILYIIQSATTTGETGPFIGLFNFRRLDEKPTECMLIFIGLWPRVADESWVT